MSLGFDASLASTLQNFVRELRSDSKLQAKFVEHPTETVVSHLHANKITIPEMFHAHAVNRGNPLPEEPRLATIDRYVYIFRKDDLFEFMKVPGSPDGNDGILTNPQWGACCCCNCCAIEI